MSFKNHLFSAGLIFTSISTAFFGSPTKADDQDWYLTIGGGLATIQDTEWDWAGYSGEFMHDSGFTGEVGIGKDYGRSRLEITYARNSGDLDSISVDQAGTAVSVSGGVTQDGLFVTGLYELTEDEDSQFTPYVGAGMGLNWTKWDNITVAGTNIGDTWVRNLAGQLKIGTIVDVSEANDFFLEGVYTVQGGYEEYGSVGAMTSTARLVADRTPNNV